MRMAMSEAEVPTQDFPCTHGICWSGRRHVSDFLFCRANPSKKNYKKGGLLDANSLQEQLHQRERRLKEMERELRRREQDTMALVDVKQEYTGEG